MGRTPGAAALQLKCQTYHNCSLIPLLAMRDSGFSFRTPEALQHRLWIVWLSDLLYAILFVWVYVRGREDKPSPARGFRYGVLMTLFTIVPNSLNEYAVDNLPHMLVVKMGGCGRRGAGDPRVPGCGHLPEEDRSRCRRHSQKCLILEAIRAWLEAERFCRRLWRTRATPKNKSAPDSGSQKGAPRTALPLETTRGTGWVCYQGT